MENHRKDTKEPLRVLQLNSGSRNFGGVSSFLFQVYRHIDREKIQFDFLAPEETTYGIVRDRINEMGGTIVELGIRGSAAVKKIRLYRQLTRYLKEHPYRIVHINSGNFFFNITACAAAKKAGVPVRIIHSHNAGDAGMPFYRKILFRLLKPALFRLGTHFAACSVKAAEYMFDENAAHDGRVKIINNGIETERFAYNPGARREVRDELGLGGRLAVGHVGRFMKQKNHEFLLVIFSEVIKKRPDAVLLLFGEGELMEQIRKKAGSMGLSESVRFLGQRPDMNRYYQAMDIFLLPSLHEGLPVSGIEAQASGLPVITSDAVTEELKILDQVRFLSLDAPPSKWADLAVSMAETERKDGSAEVAAAGYSIEETARELEEFYLRAGRKTAGSGK